MSKITKAADAPEGEIRYSFALESFSVSDGETFETNDLVVLAQAESEPWLEVEYDEVPAEVLAEPSDAPRVAANNEPIIETVTDPSQEAVQESSINNEVVAPAQEEAVQPTPAEGPISSTPSWKKR